MIHPDLKSPTKLISRPAAPHATMLAAIATDADISSDALQLALGNAVAQSFNRVSVDGDTSTNDTIVVLAGAQAPNPRIRVDSPGYTQFEAALTEVCISLAKQIAADGEGATRLVEIVVKGAIDHSSANQAAKTVATSPLVKTAIFGSDPNWGRILAAVGRSGTEVDPRRTSLWLGDVQLVANGTPLVFDKSQARQALAETPVIITIDLGIGSGQATVWTCDMSYKYVEINAEYHT